MSNINHLSQRKHGAHTAGRLRAAVAAGLLFTLSAVGGVLLRGGVSSAAAPQSCGSSVYSYTGPAVAIPDNNSTGVNVTLNVSGFTGTAGDVNFRIDGSSCTAAAGATTVGVDHTWTGDLVFKLTSPQGTTVTIINMVGGSANNFCGTLLDDETVGSIQSVSGSSAPYTGAYAPANPLAAFKGQNPNGTWTLNVSDRAGADTGNVRAFSLVIAPCPPPNDPPTVSLTAPTDGATYTVPANITLTATAADADGAVSKVEFFQGSTKLGEDNSAPYTFQWDNVIAGGYTLTAKATDNGGAVTTSTAVAVNVNPWSTPDESFYPDGPPCPSPTPTWERQDQFDNPGQIVIPLNMNPCEQITFNGSWDNGPNNGALFTLTLYNYKGQELYAEVWNGATPGSFVYPNTTPVRAPWRATRAPVGLPAFAIWKAASPFGAPARYKISYSRQRRPDYNKGGGSFDNALPVSIPSTWRGSIYQGMQPQHPTDPGQFFKVHLETGQGVYAYGYATGSTFYGAGFGIEVYDSDRHLLPYTVLNPNWTYIAAYGREEYKTQTFVNNNNPGDFYIRVWTRFWPTWDFEMNLATESCPTPPETRPTAPDATGTGPNSVTSSEYKLPASLDPEVLAAETGVDFVPSDPSLTGRETELWARVTRPTTLSAGPYPLILLLHGNHGTCGRGSNPHIDTDGPFTDSYALNGTCPSAGSTVNLYGTNYTSPYNYTVVNNHLGYSYLADQLASRGYIVVSINSNRGINILPGPDEDQALILARGRLVLKHLVKLSDWNAHGGTPASLGVDLQGKIDFSNVGLMGHSRGGQGVRAAYVLYNDVGSLWPGRMSSAIGFKAIFEVAPTDYLTQRTVSGAAVTSQLEPVGVKWNVLLPMCDADVSDLEGVRPFDRLMVLGADSPPTQKSTFTVWGANHNFFNTEWQQSDAGVGTGCIGGGNAPLFSTTGTESPLQKQIGLASVVAFFRANVGTSATPSYNQNFDPKYNPPNVVASASRVERGFTPSPSSTGRLVLEDFTGSPCGPNNACSNITVTKTHVPEHDASLDAAAILWNAGSNKYFEAKWGAGADVSTYSSLDFRVSRQLNVDLNPPTATNFTIQLVMADGSLSTSVKLCNYLDLKGPVGGYSGTSEAYHRILQTVRIPLTHFSGASLSQVKGVRITFSDTPTGAIYLANVHFAR
jgi:subtilisin-like proprotein convertase family protein